MGCLIYVPRKMLSKEGDCALHPGVCAVCVECFTCYINCFHWSIPCGHLGYHGDIDSPSSCCSHC